MDTNTAHDAADEMLSLRNYRALCVKMGWTAKLALVDARLADLDDTITSSIR